MKQVRWDHVILGLLVVILFAFRLALSLSAESLSYDSYLGVRQIEQIRETGNALREDPLSITGQLRVGSPLFDYIMAGLLVFGQLTYKIVPNLLMALILIPVYLLTFEITKSRGASLAAAILAAAAPMVFKSYLNTPASTPLSLLIMLWVLALLGNPNKNLPWIVGLALFLTFLSPVAFILVLGLFLTIVLLRLEGYGVDKRINELFFFTLILAVWFNVLVYKKALFADGIGILWQNLPSGVAAMQFGNLTLLDVVFGLGVITVLFGALGTYHALFESRMKGSFAVIGTIIAVAMLLLLRMIEISLGLLFLSILLAIMAGHGLVVSFQYIRMTKFSWSRYPVIAAVVFLFIFSAVLPALTGARSEMQNAPSHDDITAFRTLKSEISPNSIILTTVREAAVVQYFSGRTTLTDSDFLLLENGDELIRDIDTVYTSPFVTSVISKADKLGFTHILFSHDAQRQYDRQQLKAEDHVCLPTISVTSGVYLYRVVCRGDEL